jgi:glycosidase
VSSLLALIGVSWEGALEGIWRAVFADIAAIDDDGIGVRRESVGIVNLLVSVARAAGVDASRPTACAAQSYSPDVAPPVVAYCGGSREVSTMNPRLRTGVLLLVVAALGACATHAPREAAQRCQPPAFGDVTLYLRGSMNNWAALDEYAFQYRCDAWYLNVEFAASHDFKVADAAWSDASTFGAPAGGNGLLVADAAYTPATNRGGSGTGNLRFTFTGEHTLRLAIADGRPALSIGPKTFADPNARTVADPIALSVRFDSRDAAHKAPFGAAVPGTPIEFSLSALPGIESATLVIESRRLEGNQEVLEYTELARVPLQRRLAGDLERWVAQYRFDAMGIYGYWFEVRIDGVDYVYQNNKDAVFWTRERGSGGLGAIAHVPAQRASLRRYRHTIYDADFRLPDWAPDIVYYYIFPERFRNGDPGNDPRPGPRTFRDHSVEVHADWNDQPWLNGSGDGSDAHYSNDFFGGDIAGIIDKLDYIRDLGANTLYLTPVFLASSNHKYDTADYTRIDPGFGSDDDFSRLTAEAARRGIRVIPDTSLNHSGNDSVYFDRYGKHPGVGAFEGGEIRSDSPYASWYRFHPDEADPERQYSGWTGVRDLPELDKSSADFRNFAYGSPGGVMQRWLDRGAAGWRMDVAPWVPDDFWREWRAAIKAHQPDALTVAETWFDASKYLLGDMFDSTMNYIFRNSVIEYAAGGDASKLYGNIELMREAYPPQAFYGLMNLLSTHDQARTLHILGHHGDESDAATIALAKRRLRLAVLLQMTFPGAPTVFYGDEVGVTGGDDPYNRVTYPWADLGGMPDLDLLADFKRYIGLRNQHAVLRRGSIDAPIHLDANVIVWLRRLGDQVAIVATNNANATRLVTLELPADLAGTAFTDALSGTRIDAAASSLVVDVPPLGGLVLIREPDSH